MSFDYEAELSKAAEVDIWIFYFPAIRKSLMIDTRNNEFDKAMVRILPSVNSAEERLRTINRLRPRFPATDKIVFLRPPLDMAVLERSAIWAKMLEKLNSAAQTDAVSDCKHALAELATLESTLKELHTVEGAIMGGVGWGTLWERRSGS